MFIDIFFASAHFSIKFQYFNLHFWFFVFCYSFVKGPLSLVSAICSQRTAVLVYLFYTQAAVLVTRFVHKGPRSLSFAVHLQRTAVLFFRYSFAKDRAVLVFWLFIFKGLLSLSSAVYFQRTALVLCYSFAKDCSPCLVVYICKGPLSLSCPIRLQRTAFLVLCH